MNDEQRNDSTHVDDVLDAYALGALEPDEVGSVEAHLEGCARCRALEAAARRTSEALLASVPQVEPPPALRGKVLARIRAEASQAGAARSAAPQSVQDAPPSVGAFRRLTRTLFGAEMIARDMPEAVSALLAEYVAQPDYVVWEVGGTDDAPEARARLIGVPGRRDAVLLAAGLRGLPPDRAYQVWFLRDGTPSPSNLFRVARDGRGRAIVRAPDRLSGFQTVAVTPEPATGSTGPTGPIVLVGQLER